MTHTPLTEQQLTDLEALAKSRHAALSGWINCYSPLSEQEALEDAEAVLGEDVPALVAEVRRLRAELEQRTEDLASAENPTRLRWGLNDVMWGDDDSVIVLLSGPEGEPYWLELEASRAAVLREDLAGPHD
ncbi:hypothetical protein [Streptomyces canus]|uniref:hypothetical protein n=1 Tax=Streptomyces canus TaxID=58343 RepID=UPI0003666D2A|nr:hypothetical protein [Streptomyces canus]